MPKRKATIVSANTTASADSALAVLCPNTPNMSLPLLARMVLHPIVPAALVVLDYHRSRVYVTSEGSVMTLLWSCVAGETVKIEVTPDTTGLVTHWSIQNQTAWGVDESSYFHAGNRRSMQQVIEHLRLSGASQVMVDQTTGVLTAVISADAEAVSDSLDAVTPSGDSYCFLVSETPAHSRLPFE